MRIKYFFAIKIFFELFFFFFFDCPRMVHFPLLHGLSFYKQPLIKKLFQGIFKQKTTSSLYRLHRVKQFILSEIYLESITDCSYFTFHKSHLLCQQIKYILIMQGFLACQV